MSTRPDSAIRALLGEHGLADAHEEPFPNDGWSGATLTRLVDVSGRAFVLKRTSLARDWIAQATHDTRMREVRIARAASRLPLPARYPALGAVEAVEEGGETAILMPDLSGTLFDWDSPISVGALDRVLEALAALHDDTGDGLAAADVWTGWRDRLTLICRSSLERAGPARDAVRALLLPGWDAWDRVATPDARAVVGALSDDAEPLLAALGREPSGLNHGDLKLANVGIAADGAVEMVDWQMAMVAPAAVELGWFLVSNVNALPLPPDLVLERYWRIRGRDAGRENDLSILVGLLLRGWRKGSDTEAGVTLGSGVSAAEDLAWWCARAVEAAERVL
jgi:aminoglycoside phosphotransferase (APT) family kinase protein